MRILLLTNLYPTPHQPCRAAYNRQHVRAFVAAGHAVRVIAPVAWTDEWSARRRGAAPLPAGRTVELDGIRVDHPRFVFPPKVARGTYGTFYRLSVARTFRRVCDAFKPDVVLASWAYPDGAAAVRLGHAAGLPVVVNVVGSDVLLAGGSRLRRVGDAVRRADGVLAASRQLAEKVVALGAAPDRVRAVHNGVDTALFCPGDRLAARTRVGLNAGQRVVLFVGNFLPVKGADVLIDACGRLARTGDRLACFLIGQGPLRASLEKRALAAGADVRFVGPVDHDALPDWFRAADVAVLPSRSEGVPNVLLEAIACGTPFVATRVGGVPEVAGLGRGRLVPSDDASALGDAIAVTLTEAAAGAASPGLTESTVRSHADAASDILDLLGRTVRQFTASRRPAVDAIAAPAF